MQVTGAIVKPWQNLTREDFVELNAQLTGYKIAQLYGVTPGAVYYRFRMFGINKSRSSKKFKPPIDEIRDLYQRMGIEDIAKHYGVGQTTVFMYLKANGIDGITTSQRLSGRPKSLEHRLAMSKAMREQKTHVGEKNGNWKGGAASLNSRGRSKAAYMDWKSAVLANAKWKCQGCGKEHGYVCECCGHRILLHCHHVKPFSEHPELRYEASNGIALCERCHWKVHHKQLGELLETP